LRQQQPVEKKHAHRREGKHRIPVTGPALLAVGLGTDEPVDHPLDSPVSGIGVHPGHVVAERNVQHDDEQDHDENLQ